MNNLLRAFDAKGSYSSAIADIDSTSPKNESGFAFTKDMSDY